MTTKNHLNRFEKLDSKTLKENSKTADELLLVEHLDADNTEYLAGLLLSLGRYDESIREFEKLLKMKDDNTGKISLSIAINYFYMGDYESSSEYLEDAFLNDSKNETTLSYMMLAYEFLGDLESAVRSGEHILTIDSKNKSAINRLIEYHFQLGNYEKCLYYIKRTEYRDTYKKAVMLYRLGRFGECIREAVKIKTSEAYRLAGKAYLELDNTVKAVKFLYKSYQKDLNTDTLFEISEIYFDAGDSQRAIHYLREVLLHDEDNADAYVKIAEAYLDSSKWQDAIYHARKALEITKKLPESYVVLADAYFQIEGIEKVLGILDEGLGVNPDSARLWAQKGGYSYPINMVAFHESFKKAIELKPNDGKILLEYINLLMMDEEYEVAKVYYNRLLVVNPLFEVNFDEIYEKWFYLV